MRECVTSNYDNLYLLSHTSRQTSLNAYLLLTPGHKYGVLFVPKLTLLSSLKMMLVFTKYRQVPFCVKIHFMYSLKMVPVFTKYRWVAFCVKIHFVSSLKTMPVFTKY